MASTHPFLDTIRTVIEQYERQSPSHGDLEIEVRQYRYSSAGPNVHDLSPVFRIGVIIESTAPGFEGSIRTTCRPEFVAGAPTGNVQAKRLKRYIRLEKFLRLNFPVEDDSNPFDTAWFCRDPQDSPTFNWAGLPVELKEHVISFCMHEPLTQGRYSNALSRYKVRPASNRELGPYEVVVQLGDWFGLLSTSKQTRAIALQLCLKGNSRLTLDKGLCINPWSYSALEECITRLGKHYQMIEENCLPVDEQTRRLAHQYYQFPKLYPNLKQYATMRDGIQRVCLKMDFISYMNFFRVKIGGYGQYQNDKLITYEAFQRLPRLKEIIIRLPLRPKRGWTDDPYQGGPQLFHYTKPCPRKLHRVIFERAAEVLAPYESVKLLHCIDEGEQKRFNECRQAAIGKLKLTESELDEIYADDEGGVDLGDWFEPGMAASDEGESEFTYDNDADKFFPPGCECLEDCIYEGVFF